MTAAAIPAALAPANWKVMLRACVGAEPASLESVLSSWLTEPESPNQELDKVRALLAMMGAEDAGAEWSTGVSEDTRFASGVYSPVQPLMWRCAQDLGDGIEADYPFLFRLVGLTTQLILDASPDPSAIASWPPAEATYRTARRLLQSTFQLRELREEGEPLSIEIKIPPASTSQFELDIKRFAQVFGRGVGIADGDGLAKLAEAAGSLNTVWENHLKAPVSSLYCLDPPYELIPPREIRLILRRDGLVTIASHQNPLLEFYDGGWHVVDLASGNAMIDGLLARKFGVRGVAAGVTRAVVALAYHMATHWHPGILGIVDVAAADKGQLLEPASPQSERIGSMIREAKAEPGKEGTPVRVNEIKATGLGRVLLTCAIQDGATLFRPDGTFDSSGRILSKIGANVSGGAGTRAAKMLSAHGVAIKVSRDGGIRVFAGGPESRLIPPDGIRIR